MWVGIAVSSGLICPWLKTLRCPFPPLRTEGKAGGGVRSSAPGSPWTTRSRALPVRENVTPPWLTLLLCPLPRLPFTSRPSFSSSIFFSFLVPPLSLQGDIREDVSGGRGRGGELGCLGGGGGGGPTSFNVTFSS